MKKRLSISIIGLICAVLLVCGWTALAATSSGAAASAPAAGTFKSLSPDGSELTLTTDKGDQTLPLAKSVWVYRNEQKAQLSDLQPGDRIEAIFNSKKQAAYIRASSQPAAAPAPQAPESAAPQAQPTQPAQPTAPAAQQTAPPSAAAPQANAGPETDAAPQAQGVYPGLDGLELKVDGKHFKLQIEQDEGRYELILKPESGGTVHLKGDEAAAWIRELLASVDLKSPDARQQLLQEIAGHYGIDAGKLQIQLNARWHEAGDNGGGEAGHDERHGGGRSSAGGKQAEKHEADDQHGKSHGKENRGRD
jgi:Cu/Ag efflux protein CusF